MTDECSLCGLPTPAEPVTAPDVEGRFCCRGCLEVSRSVGEIDGVTEDAVRERVTEDVDEPPEVPPGTAEAFLAVSGMHCTTCESFLAIRGEAVDGIVSVEASYATDTLRVRYDPDQVDAETLPEALSGYGYTARFRTGSADARPPRDDETVQRLVVGGAFAMLVMPWYLFYLYPSYVGIETGILTADMTTPLGLYLPMALVGLFASVVVFYTGWPILRGGYVSLRTRQPNMDLLLSVAILSAFTYSTVALATGSFHLYFDVAVAIVLVVTAGTHYERRLKRQATGLLSRLTSMRVGEAHRRAPDGTTETVDVAALEPGDRVVVRPGDRVPIDGTVVEGVADVDEAVLTGEALPVTKRSGDAVVSGSVVTDSALVIEVGPDAESTLDRIASLVWAVQSDRPGIQRFADRLATVFVPLVILVGGGVVTWRLLAGQPIAAALLAGLTVLVVSCPCAMGLATPLAVSGGLRDALRRGIVVTNSTLFEAAPSVETVVFDKTGTLTTGEMTVRSVAGDPEAIDRAAAVEELASHPIAAAIVEHARASADDAPRHGGPDPEQAVDATVSDFERHPGEGVSGTVAGERIVVGTPGLVEHLAGPLSADLEDAVQAARADGDRPVAVGRDDRAVAIAVVGDRERDHWTTVLDALAEKRILLLTGDDESAAATFRDHPAVERVFAGVPPEGKVATIRRLRAEGPTAMVGDGTNDAPALSAADVGIAVGGTAHAADAADAVVVSGSLSDVPAVFELASATRRRIRENVGWALGYNGVAIPLAAAGLLNPLAAALAMAASSLLVVTNSRRRLL